MSTCVKGKGAAAVARKVLGKKTLVDHRSHHYAQIEIDKVGHHIISQAYRVPQALTGTLEASQGPNDEEAPDFGRQLRTLLQWPNLQIVN